MLNYQCQYWRKTHFSKYNVSFCNDELAFLATCYCICNIENMFTLYIIEYKITKLVCEEFSFIGHVNKNNVTRKSKIKIDMLSHYYKV